MDMSNKITIFLSYSWSDTEIANKIDSYFENHNIVIDRDVRAIDNWKSIKDFMNTIGKHDYVILIISDSYLHSFNCLYEMTQLIKDPNFNEKVFPLILDHDLFKLSGRVKYIKYWQNEYNKYSKELSCIKDEYKDGLIQELRTLNEINLYLSNFLQIVTDIKIPDIDSVCKKIEEVVIENEDSGKISNNSIDCLKYSDVLAINSNIFDINNIRFYKNDTNVVFIVKKVTGHSDFYSLVYFMQDPFKVAKYLVNKKNAKLYIDLENYTSTLKHIDIEIKSSIGLIFTKETIDISFGKNEITIPLNRNIYDQNEIREICIVINNQYLSNAETIIYIVNKMIIKY